MSSCCKESITAGLSDAAPGAGHSADHFVVGHGAQSCFHGGIGEQQPDPRGRGHELIVTRITTNMRWHVDELIHEPNAGNHDQRTYDKDSDHCRNALPIGAIICCIVHDRTAMRSFDLQSLQVL
jgi:hypothetical protein